MSTFSTTIQAHPRNEEYGAADNGAAIVLQSVAILYEICLAVPVIISMCKSYGKIFTKPSEDASADDVKHMKLLHRGRVYTFVSILTYIVASLFIMIQEIHEAPVIIDHMVYIFMILSYTCIFIALRSIGMEYFFAFVTDYCNERGMNSKIREDYQRLCKGIYNAFGVFSVIYWFGYIVAELTKKNNFIVTAIGLGHLYLALLCFLHAGVLHGLETQKDDENQASNLLANDQMNDNAEEEKSEAKADDNRMDTVAENEVVTYRALMNSPLIRKWTYFFAACGIILVLLGISYAAAYSQNAKNADFEFPEVHPFFLFTIFVFFAVLQSIFAKYTWI